MASYRLEFKRSAQKDLSRLPVRQFERLSAAIDDLRHEPLPVGCRKMMGSESQYRIRVGDYRVLYEIREAVLIVFVIKVGHRKDIYR